MKNKEDESVEYSMSLPHKPLTLEEVKEIEHRIVMGWRLNGDMQSLIKDVLYYLELENKNK